MRFRVDLGFSKYSNTKVDLRLDESGVKQNERRFNRRV